MKKAIACVLGLVCVVNAFSQGVDTDPKAKAILDKLSAKTKGYSSITASFNYILDNKKANLKATQKGSVSIKGQKYKLALDEYMILNNGATAWTYSKETNEVQIESAAEVSKNGLNPNEIFTIWEKGFKYKYEKETTLNGVKCDIIKLFPKDTKGKNYHTIVLTINKGKMQVQQVDVLGKSGEIYSYVVTKFAPNVALTEAEFNFDKTKYPGVDVIDNR
ncbi:MAG TPA: outer membrane lipoprotein carrier protein LolA [Luteibaculaceae bacterium]|jgi:outer membrane lipoprotein carrier protein|nr:outer membrane lipoprotein carrier protein LolA [Luteibaculaceae bacterium]